MTEEIIKQFLAIQRQFQNFMRKLQNLNEDCEFNQTEFFTMIKLNQLAVGRLFEDSPVGIGISMKTLANEISVSPAMVTKTVTGLERKGCVQRISDDSDRRGVKVYITSEGFEQMECVRHQHGYFLKKLYERVGEEKTFNFIMLAEEIMDAAEKTYDEVMTEKKQKKGTSDV